MNRKIKLLLLSLLLISAQIIGYVAFAATDTLNKDEKRVLSSPIWMPDDVLIDNENVPHAKNDEMLGESEMGFTEPLNYNQQKFTNLVDGYTIIIPYSMSVDLSNASTGAILKDNYRTLKIFKETFSTASERLSYLSYSNKFIENTIDHKLEKEENYKYGEYEYRVLQWSRRSLSEVSGDKNYYACVDVCIGARVYTFFFSASKPFTQCGGYIEIVNSLKTFDPSVPTENVYTREYKANDLSRLNASAKATYDNLFSEKSDLKMGIFSPDKFGGFEKLEEFECKTCPTCGSCSGMYTANSMNCLTEVLGMGLRGNGTIPAVYSARIELAKHAGMQVMELVRKNIRPLDIMTEKAFHNALTADMALGCSTNSMLHLPAIANECGIQLNLDMANEISAKTPNLCHLAPAGPTFMEDLEEAGGVYAVLKELTKYPIKTRLNLSGTLIVARDIAHAQIKAILDSGKPMPEYFKKHPIYYAGPAKTPQGMPSGSFGPTTAGRMDPYVDLFQDHGASLIMVAKGNRSQAVTDACKKHGGFYLGSIGGPAAILAKNSIKSVEVVDFEELGMEAVRKIRVENFPAFIIVDDKGNDFFAEWSH